MWLTGKWRAMQERDDDIIKRNQTFIAELRTIDPSFIPDLE